MHGDNVPLVSVIVPVFDDRERLERCLDALARQTYSNYEVIVVDNGSREAVADLDGHYDVRLANEATPGSYAARNRGLSLAAGEVIAFTDSDCILAPEARDVAEASKSGGRCSTSTSARSRGAA